MLSLYDDPLVACYIVSPNATYFSSLLTRSVLMKDRESLIGCNSSTSKYKSCPAATACGSGMSSGCCNKTLGRYQLVFCDWLKVLHLLFPTVLPRNSFDLCEIIYSEQEIFVSFDR